MARVLKYRADRDDRTASFRFAFPHRKGERTRAGYLFCCPKSGEVFIMQSPAYVADSYSDSEIAERDRLLSESPIRTGDVVEVEGARYTVRILGDYSDAGRLVPVAA